MVTCMMDEDLTKKGIKVNIEQALDKIDSDGEQKVLDIIKKALESYSEDRRFIAEIFEILVSRTREFKIENNRLTSELRQWSATYQRTGPYLRWRYGDKVEWEYKRYSDEFLRYRENIDDYFTGFDKNKKNMIFEYPNGIEEKLPPELFENMKSKLSVDEAKRLYIDVVKVPKNLISLIRKRCPDKKITPELKRICNFLMKYPEEVLSTKKIWEGANVSKQTAHNNLNFLYENKWVSKLPSGRWCLNKLDNFDQF